MIIDVLTISMIWSQIGCFETSTPIEKEHNGNDYNYLVLSFIFSIIFIFELYNNICI